MKDPVDFYRGTWRARWNGDYDIVIERRRWTIVRDGFLGFLLVAVALAVCITGLAQ